MAAALDLPRGRMAALVVRQPSLLMLGSASLRSKVQGLQSLLGPSPDPGGSPPGSGTSVGLQALSVVRN
jgi:hypothetical protein